MRQWNLGLKNPQNLIVAADSRMNQLDYANDQIWELQLGPGDPTAITLQTTYGLRARNMRIFPQFTENHQVLSDPKKFYSPLIVQNFYPNYIKLMFSPFTDIEIEMEYWVPDCQSVAGRVHIKNSSLIDRNILFDLVSLLNPIGYQTQAMVPKLIEAVNVLHGKTSNLSPVVFITGGAKAINSPYPGLSHNLNLAPGAFRQFTWVQVALNNFTDSFKQARKIATKKWSSEIAKIEMKNSNQIEVQTGNSDWDAIIALGQKTANTLLYSGSQHLSETSFVLNRLPDQGYSNIGDGSDYNHLWNGQSALDAWYLSQYLLPGSPEILEGILLNFFNTQNKEGQIDWKPGLAGQRSYMQALPILSTLTWKLYQYQDNKDFLKIAYPHLIKFIMAWFDKNHDRNGNGIPEWDNALQTGYEDNPIFTQYHQWAQGLDINLFGSPDLCAYLFKECKNLIKISKEIKEEKDLEFLEDKQKTLNDAVSQCWDDKAATYRYWDQENNINTEGKKLAQRKGPGKLQLGLSFEQAVRLQLRFDVGSDVVLNTNLSVQGKLANGQNIVENIDRKNIRWMPGLGFATTKSLFSQIDSIKVNDLPKKAKMSVFSVDLKKLDQTLLTPIWAGIPEPEQVQKLISKKLTKDKAFHRNFGLPASITRLKKEDSDSIRSVWLPWNVMLMEGLISYQNKKDAQDLFERIMEGIVKTIKIDRAFRKHHHAEKGIGLGERNALAGLPPLGVFFDLLGVQIHSPWKVSLSGFNPFPWPITLKFQGLKVECYGDNTRLTFPNEQSVLIKDPSPCLIEISK